MKRILLVLLALSGCFISAVLLGLSQPSSEPMRILGAEVCSPGASVNCDYVLASGWGRVGPVRTALLGLLYFAALAGWFAIVGPANYLGRRWHLLPLIGVAAGLCGSLYLVYLMAFRLPVWCTWCVAAHLANAGIFVLTAWTWPRRPRPTARPAAASAETPGLAPIPVGVAPAANKPHPSGTRVLATIGCLAGLMLLILMASVTYNFQAAALRYRQEYVKIANDADYIVCRHQQAPLQEIPLRPDDPSMGPADAPHTIVVLSDFECPKCQSFFFSAGSIVQRFPGKVRIVFRHYPLSSACNSKVGTEFHYFSCEAAQAAEAARQVGTPEQVLNYYRLLYANAARLDERPYEKLAADAGLDAARFAAALRNSAGRDRLSEDIALGERLAIDGTPALFLDGRRLRNWRIMSGETEIKVDAEKTLTLWERLLGEQAIRAASSAAAEDSTTESALGPTE